MTIAQAFAHAPKLDPSGTSWLPFPFWALGSAMAAAGRSLVTARVTSITLASLAATLPYLALRTTGVPRARALLGVAFAVLSPWSLWLGSATVPESFTASFTAAAAIGLGAAPLRASAVSGNQPEASRTGPGWARASFAAAMLAACLSRYEAWPVAAVLATVLAVRALRNTGGARARARKVELAIAALVAIGPLAWMAWNLRVHADALHFFARVSRFKRELGEGAVSTPSALLMFPRLLLRMRMDVLGALLLGAAAFSVSAKSLTAARAEARERWRIPLLCAAAQLAFLAYGNARDGAPAHHAERALLGIVFIMAPFAIDVLGAAAPAALAFNRGRALWGAVLAFAGWVSTAVMTYREVPGSSEAENRAPQIASGRALRDQRAGHLVVTPCAYEHFALIAAFEAPERVDIRPASVPPRALPANDAPNAPPAPATCPAFERR